MIDQVGEFVFYEGPPTANGKLGIHHRESCAFNTFYAMVKMMNKDGLYSPHRIAVTEAAARVLKNRLFLFGIEAPEKM